MDWGNSDFQKRGPVVVSRSKTTIRRRNAIGGNVLFTAAVRITF